jgi:alpha-amylase
LLTGCLANLKFAIIHFLQARRDAGIVAKSKLEIQCAEGDMYVGRITGTKGSLVLKLGPRYDMGALLPKQEDGWAKAAVGKDFCVWIKVNDEEVAATAEQQ